MKKIVKTFLLIFLIISVSFTTIAYAGLSTRFSITSEADIRVPADIRVTGISTGGLNGNSTNYQPRYSVNTVTMGFNIAAGSTINYNVTVRNSGDIDQTIYEITTISTNNPNVTCTTTGYNVRDVIGYRDSVTFGITCTLAVSASNVNIILGFNFKKVYHITYDANNGTDAPDEQLKYEDVDLTLANDEPTRTNYTFIGWNESSSATTAQYEPGDTYTLNSDKVLYAVWRQDKYAVTYDVTTNGGSGTNDVVLYDYESTINPSTEKTASKSGWTFVGWNTNRNATTGLSSYQIPANASTLYAIYSKTLTGTFNYYNDQSTTKLVTIYNTATSGSITSPTLSNSSFTESDVTYTLNARGWSTSIEGDATIEVDKNADVTLVSNATYYASYSYTVTVTWSANSGSAPAKTSETKNAYMGYTGSKVGVAFTMPAATTRNYYDFAGWGTSKYAAGSSQTFSSNQSLPAQWTAKSYTITLDPKFYSGTSTTVLVTPSTSGTTSITSKYNTSLSPTSISRPYTSTIAATNGTIYAITYNGIKYGFEGYYTSKSCGGTQMITAAGAYTNFTSTTYTSATTLYACWKAVNAGAVTSASYVSYTNNGQTTLEGALNDLYNLFE